MTKWNLNSKRKKTGGLLKKGRKKKRYQRARDYLPSHVGKKVVKVKKARSDNVKRIGLGLNEANVMIEGKAQKTKIIHVIENPADPHFVRRNIVTKGAIIQTEIGKARVTSRPGQSGAINAVLIDRTMTKEKIKKK